MSKLFERFFHEDVEESEDDVNAAHDLLTWSRLPHFEKFMKRLRRRAYEPLNLGNQMEMAAQIMKTNLYKELIEEVTAEVARAENLIEIHKGRP